MTVGSHFLTKKELKNMIQDFDYNIFKIPQERFKDLFFNAFEGVKNETTFLYAVKKPGKMFTYDEGIVPVGVYFLKQKKYYTKKVEVQYMRFIAYTIDDYSMGFFKTFDTVNEYEKFLKEVVKPYLNSFTEMPSEEEFIKFFEPYNVDFDFN